MLQVEGQQESEKKIPKLSRKKSPNNFPPLGEVLAGSGADAEARFWKAEGSGGHPGQVPEGSGAGAEARFSKLSVQRLRLGQVPDGSGAHTQVRFRKVPVQMRRSGSGMFRSRDVRCRCPGQVPEGSGTEVR